MKKKLQCTVLFSLLISSFVYAQQTTFTFTPAHTTGTGNNQTFQQTVNGITCTVTFEVEKSGMSVSELTDGDTFVNSEGLWMGIFVPPPNAKQRTPFARPGARITFSHDVRLKSYTLGRYPHYANITYCYLRGGNVTALADYDDYTNYTGERPFELECVVPAGTPLLTSVGPQGNNSTEWRFSSLTVEPETYVAPVIPIPEGNETGITRIDTLVESSYKHSFALKNGRLHHWTSSSKFLSRDFIFDGAQSGVLDFIISTGGKNIPLLIETVEGFALFEQDSDSYYYVVPLDGTLPADPDHIFVGDGILGVYVMALKDGEIYFDGPSGELMRSHMPAELATGGVSEIAASDYAALAVKDGQFYMWGEATASVLSALHVPIPEAVTNGEILHLAAYSIDVVVQLTSGELIYFGQGGSRSLSADQTSGEIFADLRFEEDNIIAFRDDGSFLLEEVYRGAEGGRVNKGYEGPFYEIDPDATVKTNDFLLRGLEIPPAIVQQLGYEQIAFG